MNSVLSTCVERSNVVGPRSGSRAEPRASARARRAFGPLLGLTLLVSGCRGCSYHAHSEWHAGSGSSGGEKAAEPHEHGEGEGDGSTRSTHRRSPGGRDNVVRVSGDGNKSQGGQSGGGDGERTVVRPSGDVPPSSSGGSGQGASGDGAQRSGSGEGNAAAGAGGAATGKVDEPAAPAQPAEPAAAAPAEQAPDSGKTTNKNPSEPHVTTPTHRKPRKVHRDGATNKEGRRE